MVTLKWPIGKRAEFWNYGQVAKNVNNGSSELMLVTIRCLKVTYFVSFVQWKVLQTANGMRCRDLRSAWMISWSFARQELSAGLFLGQSYWWANVALSKSIIISYKTLFSCVIFDQIKSCLTNHVMFNFSDVVPWYSRSFFSTTSADICPCFVLPQVFWWGFHCWSTHFLRFVYKKTKAINSSLICQVWPNRKMFATGPLLFYLLLKHIINFCRLTRSMKLRTILQLDSNVLECMIGQSENQEWTFNIITKQKHLNLKK